MRSSLRNLILILIPVLCSAHSWAVISVQNCSSQQVAIISESFQKITPQLERIFNEEFSYYERFISDEVGNPFTEIASFEIGFNTLQVNSFYHAIYNTDLNIKCTDQSDQNCNTTSHTKAFVFNSGDTNTINMCPKAFENQTFCDVATTLFHELAHVIQIPIPADHNSFSQVNFSITDKVYLLDRSVNNLCLSQFN